MSQTTKTRMRPHHKPAITRRLLLAGAAVLACAPALAAPRERTPYTMLAAIYGQRQFASAFGLDVKEREAFFSRDVLALWAKADAKTPPGDAGPIDWDVSTNSQGMEVGTWRVKVARNEPARVDLVVTLTPKTPWVRKSPDENIIRYRFIREDGRWVIDDIRGAADAPDKGLKSLLTRAAADD
jgi:hypothetical protein